MESSRRTPPYLDLILLVVFGSLFFYFLYELAMQEDPILDGVIMVVCGIFAIKNYVSWKRKLKRPIQ